MTDTKKNIIFIQQRKIHFKTAEIAEIMWKVSFQNKEIPF